jgi:V/A-type H+-transporting ATPase subunit C
MARTVSGNGEGNYAYACARVKARKSSLLPKDTYPRFLNMDLPQIGRSLGEGQYRREVDELSSTHAGVDLIERATYLNLARTYHSVLDFTTGELHSMVRLFLNRWDVYNIKTVLRGKLAGADWRHVDEELVLAGAFHVSMFRSLFESGGPEEMAAILGRATADYDFEPALLRLIREQGGALPDLARLENEMERDYYIRLQSVVPETTRANRLFLEYLRMESDVVNLKTLFKLKFGDAAVENAAELLIPAGEELTPAVQRALVAAEGYDAFLAELSRLRLYERLRVPASSAPAQGSLNEVLLALDRHLMQRALSFSHLYPLSVLPVIDYLLRKRTEVDNIRIIARGKQSGLPEETIRSLLML